MTILRPLLAAAVALAAALPAAEGVTPTAIKLGQCAALSGPAKALGANMNLGLMAAFKEANAGGGVNGRQLALATADDQYEPDKTVDGTGRLIEEEKVFALCGFVGTPTGKAALPILAETKVPLVGLFTGAGIFRKPDLRYVVNVRASYDQETELLVERFTKDLGAKAIAIFMQNDAFGQAGLQGTEAALKRRGMALAGKGLFERNTVAVKGGLADLIAAKPDAVVMIGAYKPLAAFVKEARAAGLKAPCATISFVGTEAFIAEAGKDGDGVAISQVVPSPADASVPAVKAFQTALAASDPAAKPTYGAFEGYLTGRVLIEGLKAAGAEPTRESLIDALEAMKADIGGFAIAFDKATRQGSQQVWLTQVADGSAKPVTVLAK